MYLVSITRDKAGKEFTDIFPGKTGEIEELENLATILLEEVDGKGEIHFYSSELDDLGRVETPCNGAPDPIIGFRATGDDELKVLVFSPYSGEFVTESEYVYEEFVAAEGY